MMHRKAVATLLVGCCLLVAGKAFAGPKEDAAEHSARAKTLLSEAKFDEAMQAYREAAKADRTDHTYRRMYAILRQVVQLRESVSDPETDEKDWLNMADALRSFYNANGLYGETLPLDQKILKGKLVPDAAERLASTQIELGMNEQAGKTLATGAGATPSARAQVLQGLALARQGKTDEAGKFAAKVKVDKELQQRCLYELARLRSLLGDAKGMSEALTRCFQITPPGQLDGLKSDAKESSDFAGMVSSPEFAEALTTKSTISGCGRAGGCGGCAKKGGCSKSKAAGAKTPGTEAKGGCPHSQGKGGHEGHDHGKDK